MDINNWYKIYAIECRRTIRKEKVGNIAYFEERYHKHATTLYEYYDKVMNPLDQAIKNAVPFHGRYKNRICIFVKSSNEYYSVDFYDEDDIETLLKTEPYENLGLYTNISPEDTNLFDLFKKRLDGKIKPIKKNQKLVDAYFRAEHIYTRRRQIRDMYSEHMTEYITKRYGDYKRNNNKMIRLIVNNRVYLYEVSRFKVTCLSTPETVWEEEII